MHRENQQFLFFLFCLFVTGFLCVRILVFLDLTLQTRLVLNLDLTAFAQELGLNVFITTAQRNFIFNVIYFRKLLISIYCFMIKAFLQGKQTKICNGYLSVIAIIWCVLSEDNKIYIFHSVINKISTNRAHGIYS